MINSLSKRMTLFYILKVNTSEIISNNLYIKTDFKTCKNNGNIISLGDTQVFRFIRRIKDEEFDKEYVENLYRQRNLLKQQDKVNVKEIIKIQNEINERLYVPDLVTVKTDTGWYRPARRKKWIFLAYCH